MPFLTKPELEPTTVPSLIDIAWSAGIYEGEGHVRNRRSAATIVQVSQKDPELLFRLREWFGGKVSFAKCSTIPAEHQCHVWIVCGDKCRLFIALVYPFLTSRRKVQVDDTRALSFLNGESSIGLTLVDIKNRLERFNLTRYKGGSTPEEQRRYRIDQRIRYGRDHREHNNDLRRVRRAKEKLTLVA